MALLTGLLENIFLWNSIEFLAIIKQSSLKYLDFNVVYDDANIATAIDTVMVFVNWPKKWDFLTQLSINMILLIVHRNTFSKVK